MTSRFKQAFFVGNREKLCAALPGYVIVLSAHSLLQSSADLHFPLRQDSSFWYFTGVSEPDVWLFLDTDTGKSTLLLPELNDYQAEWDGQQDHEKLKQLSGTDGVAEKTELPLLLKQALKDEKKIGYMPPPPEERIEPYGFYANPSRKFLERALRVICAEKDLVDVRMDIARLRQVKQPVELAAIQEAIDTTAEALQDAKQRIDKRELKTEKDIERRLSAHFYGQADGHAYDPIIASGKNATTIHYVSNDSDLFDNGLILLDVGANVAGYAADISRTWSVGEPTARQKEVFAACIELQEIAFSKLKPGVLLREYQKEMDAEAQKVFKKLNCSMAGKDFPHGFSHFLGLDVHDAGDYQAPLVEGSVITVEPGIYLPDEGIGVRIEDDVLITKNGIKNLSENIPKVL